MEEKTNSFINGLISFIFNILIIALIAFSAWFCVDYFELIELSENTSIISLIGKYDSYVLEGVESNDSREEMLVKPRKRDVTASSNYSDEEEESPISKLNPTNVTRNNNSDGDFNSTQFYYSQLNEYSKYIYDEIYSNYENLKSGTFTIDFGNHFNDLLHKENGENILNDSFQLALNSLTFDKPELYFINITKMYLFTDKTSFAGIVRYKNSVGPAKDENFFSDSFADEAETIEQINVVDQKVNEVIEEANRRESDVDKIEYIHSYIIENCQYSKEYQNIYNAYGVICDGNAVCEGYSKALKLFLDKLNIENIIVCGTGTNSSGQVESHAWNYVLLDGVWYAVDSTWDDPIVIGISSATYAIMHKYFLVGSDTITKDHVANGVLINSLTEHFEFEYPTLSINDYKEW